MHTEKKKVVFLFGAGCEGKGQLGFPSGSEFKREIICADGVSKLFKMINPYSSYVINEGKFLHHNASNVLYQTLKECDDDCKLRLLLGEEIINQYLNYKDGNQENDGISNRFAEIYRKQIYNPIIHANEPLSEVSELFLERASFFSFADSLFNYIRKPELYAAETTKVMKMYFAAYNSILSCLRVLDSEWTSIDGREQLEKFLREISSKDNIENYLAINPKDKCPSIDSLYYSVIGRFKKNIDISVITTNYTFFAQNIMDLECDDIAYLHGKMDWFEDIKTKEVKPIGEHSKESTIFPFIFVQSGVKPVVSQIQIKEYTKAIKFLEEAENVVILGYGLNSDDEHIITMLRDCVKDSSHITYLIYIENEKEQQDVIKKKNDELCKMFGENHKIGILPVNDLEKLCMSLSNDN